MAVAVYHHRAADGSLLYVGLSNCPTCRAYGHKQKSEWICLVASIDVTWFETREKASEFEVSEIQRLRPPFNRTHSGRVRIRPTQQNGEVLGEWISKNGLSIEEFADRAGLGAGTVRAIASSKQSASSRTQLAIEVATKGELQGDLFARPQTYLEEI